MQLIFKRVKLAWYLALKKKKNCQFKFYTFTYNNKMIGSGADQGEVRRSVYPQLTFSSKIGLRQGRSQNFIIRGK